MSEVKKSDRNMKKQDELRDEELDQASGGALGSSNTYGGVTTINQGGLSRTDGTVKTELAE